MGEIISLCTKNDYCWVSNDYLAQAHGISRRTVISSLRSLASKGYIKIEYSTNKEKQERRIFDTSGGVKKLHGGGENSARGGCNNCTGGVQDLHPINTVNNTVISKGNINHLQLSREQVREFFVSEGKTTLQADEFYDHIESKDFKWSGRPIGNWKSLAKAWIKKLKPEPKLKALS